MKALVLWCRRHDARLRLKGRDDQAVWGELAFPAHSEPFRFQLRDNTLVVGAGDTACTLLLDEIGVEQPADNG